MKPQRREQLQLEQRARIERRAGRALKPDAILAERLHVEHGIDGTAAAELLMSIGKYAENFSHMSNLRRNDMPNRHTRTPWKAQESLIAAGIMETSGRTTQAPLGYEFMRVSGLAYRKLTPLGRALYEVEAKLRNDRKAYQRSRAIGKLAASVRSMNTQKRERNAVVQQTRRERREAEEAAKRQPKMYREYPETRETPARTIESPVMQAAQGSFEGALQALNTGKAPAPA